VKKQVRNFLNASQLNKKSFSDGFFLDLRSLALFRIGIGLVLIANLIVRLAMPNYLPVEDGVLPTELMNFGGSCPWSFHFFWHSLWYQNLLICLNFVLCSCYLIGHKTRCVAPLVFLFTLSINYSNCLSFNSGDVQLVLVLLLSCFLPISSFWSVDQVLAAGSLPVDFKWNSRKTIVVSLASAGFVSQIVWIYWLAVSGKSVDSWLFDADAIWGVVNIDYIRYLWFYEFVSSRVWLMQLFSRSAYLLQLLAPFLIVFPSKSGRFRMWGVSILLLMHIGFLPVLKLGLFPWISIFSLMALFPPFIYAWFQKDIAKVSPVFEEKAIIFYDKNCKFCFAAVRMIICFFAIQDFVEVKPSCVDDAADSLLRERRSWVVRDSAGALSIEFTALLELVRLSRWASAFLPLLRLFALPGRYFYRAVADHRVISWKVYCFLRPRKFNRFGKSLFSDIASIIFILLSLVSFLLSPLGEIVGLSAEASGRVSGFLRVIGIKQSWKMFSPYPLKKDGWLVVEVDMEQVEKTYYVPLLQLVEEPFRNPSFGAEMYGNQRKRKYFENLRLKKASAAHSSYLSFLCRSGDFSFKGLSGAKLILWRYEEFSRGFNSLPQVKKPELLSTLTCK